MTTRREIDSEEVKPLLGSHRVSHRMVPLTESIIHNDTWYCLKMTWILLCMLHFFFHWSHEHIFLKQKPTKSVICQWLCKKKKKCQFVQWIALKECSFLSETDEHDSGKVLSSLLYVLWQLKKNVFHMEQTWFFV